MKNLLKSGSGFPARQTAGRETEARSGGEAGKAKKKSDKVINRILVGVLAVGICLLLYPSFSDYWNSFHQTTLVVRYAENVADMQAEEYGQIIGEARGYNERLAESGIHWNLTEEEQEDYKKMLDIAGTGVMGYIRIPKISVLLPVYHGTSTTVLQTSIGHLEQSSLPVGGEGSHCLLSGHRGLPSARLFTDLDKLVEGDTFNINVLNETLTYEVDQIRIVEPDDLTQLEIVQGKDLCTLITCTPYGINTHRLLVRGHRVANANGDAMVTADAIQIRPVYVAPFIAVPMLIVLLIAGEIERQRRLRGRN